jgi:hypothetical protein
MNCANILIVYFEDNDAETNEAIGLLQQKYAGRSVNMIKCSYNDFAAPCFVPQEPKSEQKSGDTGIYVLQHGSYGFTGHLEHEPVRTAFVNWLLSLAAQSKSHKIRKLCFITCTTVEADTMGIKAKPVSENPADKGKIRVQQMCHAISAIDTKKTLDGLMVAGYTCGVSFVKETRDPDNKKPEIITNRIFRGLQRPNPMELAPEDDEAKLAKFLQERAKILDRSMHPAWHVKQVPKNQVKQQEEKMVAYVKRKRVFVLEDGKWRDGKLSEYTDKDEAWQKDWKEKLKKAEGLSGVFA